MDHSTSKDAPNGAAGYQASGVLGTHGSHLHSTCMLSHKDQRDDCL